MQDDRLDTSLANAVVRLFRQVNRIHNRLFSELGVTAEQAHILSLLAVLGPMTMSRLQKLLSLSSATLTGAIDRLENQRLVRRGPSPTDRRAVVIESMLSAKQQAQLEAIIETGEARSFAGLAARERKELLRLMTKCIDHLEADAATR